MIYIYDSLLYFVNAPGGAPNFPAKLWVYSVDRSAKEPLIVYCLGDYQVCLERSIY